VVTAQRPPADRARGGPVLITLASRTPARPGDQARVLEAGKASAPQLVAAQLGIEPLTEVVRRRQATIRDAATVAVLTSWFPVSVAEQVPELLKRARLTEEIAGYRPASGEDWVSARPPTSAEAREFGIKRGSPVAVVHSRRFGADGTVTEYAELIARADTRIIYRYDYGGG
jgi:DNA-binding GntR family transcriptional regulator